MTATSSVSEAGAVLSEDAPPVDVAQAAVVLRDLYRLQGTLAPLPSERDHNFRVRADDGRDYVLKITHPGEPRGVTNLQTMALRHIASVDPGLPVPSVTPTVDGVFEPKVALDGAPARTVRLLTYLPGRLLSHASRSAAQDTALGAFLARLGRALRGFFHPDAGQSDLLWDIRQVPRIRGFVPEIGDAARRALVERAFADSEGALPALAGLRAQVVHNDLNPSNVVVHETAADRIAGVLDFGDMLHGPLVCDIAIGACYRWSEGEHPLASAARFVAGYDAVTRLETDEIDLMFDLIRARLALTVAIVNWQARRYPDKRAYVLRLNAELWRFLDRLATVSRAEAQAVFRSHIEGTGRSWP